MLSQVFVNICWWKPNRSHFASSKLNKLMSYSRSKNKLQIIYLWKHSHSNKLNWPKAKLFCRHNQSFIYFGQRAAFFFFQGVCDADRAANKLNIWTTQIWAKVHKLHATFDETWQKKTEKSVRSLFGGIDFKDHLWSTSRAGAAGQ